MRAVGVGGARGVIEGREHLGGPGDGIHTDIGAGAMCGAAADGELRPGESLVRRCDREAGRLGDDGGVGAQSVGEECAGAEALPFLIGDGGEDDFAGGSGVVGTDGRGGHRRNAGFHIGRPAAVETAVVDGGREGRVSHPIHADGVEVAVQEDGSTAIRAPSSRDD